MASYVYGNTVRKDVTVIQKPEKQPKEISQRVRNNRTKALHMSKRYVVFLAIAASVALFACTTLPLALVAQPSNVHPVKLYPFVVSVFSVS